MIRHPAERHLIRLALHSLWDANFFICITNLCALCACSVDSVLKTFGISPSSPPYHKIRQTYSS